MSERGYRIVTDINLDGQETAAFPILCETCLGDNPYVRMIQSQADKECKICSRPYTVFRWQPGRNARFKSTIVCQTCAKLKNVCQTCLFDLEYGLPVQVRDRFLEDCQKIEFPESRVNRDYAINQMDLSANSMSTALGKAAPHPMLLKLARTAPYYKRNRARVCSFWARGECTRGDTCPYRHENDDHDPGLADQNIRDRYIGQDDPVANKILGRAEEFHTLKPPDDKAITTLFLGGLSMEMTENDIRDQFYAFGEIRSIKMIPRQGCAFVTFTSRESAESAASKLHKNLYVKGQKLRLLWGRPNTGGVSQSIVPGPPSGVPAQSAFPGGMCRIPLPMASMMPAYYPMPGYFGMPESSNPQSATTSALPESHHLNHHQHPQQHHPRPHSSSKTESCAAESQPPPTAAEGGADDGS